MNSYLGIIPARAGSKRLPGKNKRLLCSKPLIQWTIEAALESEYLTDVIVTTDDDEIISLCKAIGTKVRRRPSQLASDTATTLDVVLDVLDHENAEYDYIVLLQPTSPLRTKLHIDDAISSCEKNQAHAVVSMVKVEHPVEWTFKVPTSGDISAEVVSKGILQRSQDYDDQYRLNGAIYIVRERVLRSERRFLSSSKTFVFPMSRESSIDIDEQIDFELCELVLNKNEI